MNQDSSNPFQKLAKAFAEKTAENGARERKAARHPQTPGNTVAPKGKTCAAADNADGGDDADAALFMNAVSRIKPLADTTGKRKPDAVPLGDMLAARMHENGASGEAGKGVPPTAERSSGGRTAVPSASLRDVGRSSDKRNVFPDAEAEAFLDAMGASVRPGVPRPHSDSAHEKISEAPDDESGAFFSKAMQGVAPVSGKGRAVAAPNGADKPMPTHDPAKALREVLEGRVEFALHHTDEYMEGFVVGVDPLALARLRAGQYSPEKHLDLHGLNAQQAHDALTWFIKDAYQKGLRTVVVVTGRGKNSPDCIGVLRPMLQQWLSREPFKRVVLAFCTARPHDGGPGAVYVLLRKYKKSRGKIIWERIPSEDDFPGV